MYNVCMPETLILCYITEVMISKHTHFFSNVVIHIHGNILKIHALATYSIHNNDTQLE